MSREDERLLWISLTGAMLVTIAVLVTALTGA